MSMWREPRLSKKAVFPDQQRLLAWRDKLMVVHRTDQWNKSLRNGEPDQAHLALRSLCCGAGVHQLMRELVCYSCREAQLQYSLNNRRVLYFNETEWTQTCYDTVESWLATAGADPLEAIVARQELESLIVDEALTVESC